MKGVRGTIIGTKNYLPHLPISYIINRVQMVSNTVRSERVIDILISNRKELIALARKHGTSNIRVFGSVSRKEETRDSDIDLLVDMAENASLLDLARLKNELKDLLGRPIDITTKPALHPILADKIMKEAIPL